VKADLLDMLVCPLSGQQLTVQVLESDGDEVLHGVLSSDAGRFPIIGGIPVMTAKAGALVGPVLTGHHRDAAVAAAFSEIPRSRRRQLWDALRGARSDRLPSYDRRPPASAVEALFPVGPGEPLSAMRYAYLRSPARSVDAFAYFSYRFSIPRHIVMLSAIEAMRDTPGLVLDLGCGAGHGTWAMQQGLRQAVAVGVDLSFFQLWDARRLAPDAPFVCADATALPFRSDQFSGVLASDVLSFVTPKQTVTREAVRCLGPAGRLMFTSVKNLRCTHVYAGEPLAPAGWRSLVDGLPHRLISDESIVEAYLGGRGLPASCAPSDEELDTAQTLSIFAVKAREHDFSDAGTLSDWPHARGPLAVNPLYGSTPSPSSARFTRRFPSPSFERDNPLAATYLPETFDLGWAAITAGREGRSHSELDPQIARLAILALPPGYSAEPWPLDPASGTTTFGRDHAGTEGARAR
jgi:uncharacterized protein YbaR (Trm112 family)